MIIEFKKTSEKAQLPSFAHPNDAGMDLYTIENLVLQPGERGRLSTGIAMAIPQGYVGLIWEKSGLSFKQGIKTMGGVIDAGYRGEVIIGVINTSNEAYSFAEGDKVAQMLIQKIEHPEWKEVEELSETDRGEGGFGSTGK